MLTFTGLLASARATRNIIMVPRDPDLEVVRRFLIGDGGELEYAKLDLFANAEERSNRIVARCWNKIECVAKELHQERRISCDEHWYLLDGGTVEREADVTGADVAASTTVDGFAARLIT